MPAITIHDLTEDTLSALQRRAERSGRPLEDEVRRILDNAAHPASDSGEGADGELGFGTLMVKTFRDFGGVDLPDVRDRTPAKPVTFEP